MALSDLLLALGGTPEGARLERMRRSPHFQDGAFRNPVPTRKTLPGTMAETVRRQLGGPEQRVPPAPLPVASGAKEALAVLPASGFRATWLGHSTALIEMDGHRVLVDPVWAERASPSQAVGPRRFHPPPLPLGAVPPLDVVLITHDHYDHLDMAAVRALVHNKAHARARFVVPLGVGAHLERWGVAPSRIAELDWEESVDVGALTLTATPARHFSGRSVRDGDRTLWASWVIDGPTRRVFHSGDSGPWEGFADIGARHGPFALTMVKIGAYGPTWPDIHLDPEQAVAAHQALRGALLLPIHWGTFNLAFHAWDEPAERVLAAAESAGVALVMPRPGEPVEPDAPPPVEPWWRGVRKR
ncbi:MBL fold metallo-hydrolase [Roseisolibacter sp. H3M3-2]|uniref:MBL fold metallo-hydrolase n=1 Tax=Roseisolibacter sp. H3M3-2 TaxID=3031323 RepID=UPI0023DBDF06|nr:MBL fold metallo-hydrolase [Roseisolibacter sp. H3M3-2]MDF1502542.1 MBL fold metallo-hydrolase [Roseisolibacter sp. H3M3-2]